MWLYLTTGILALGAARPNVALNRPYTLSPAPNYALCTDPEDRLQLTDGRYTQGYFWTQKGTVGWQHVGVVFIVVDLGEEVPIAGASFNTAAGVAGVRFPTAIGVLVSRDGQRWHEVGDLVAASEAQNGPPPSEGYAVHRFWTDRWQAHGRWVAFVVEPEGPYCFVDEVEVYRGEEAWLAEPLTGEVFPDPKTYAQVQAVRSRARRRLLADAKALEQAAQGHPDILQALQVWRQQVPEPYPIENPAAFRTLLPLDERHRALFQLQGRLWRAQGLPPFSAYLPSSPYDPLPYLTPQPLPPRPSTSASLLLLRGESRPLAINWVYASPTEGEITLRLKGLEPLEVQPYRAVWTDTKEGEPIAAALLPLERRGGEYRLLAPAGMVGQIWLRLQAPRTARPGVLSGTVELEGPEGEARVSLRVRVLPLELPRERSLHLGGWDYTDVESRYGVTPKNREALIAHLRERFVDIPWASSAVLPPGRYDEEGRMVEEPNTALFDQWLARWPKAARYYVFASVGRSFANSPVGTPAFSRKVSAWIRFWWAHARQKGLRPGQLGLLLVDEPHTPEQDELTLAWAAVIKEAAPEVVIWVDPTWRNPEQMNPRLVEVADVLCPQRAHWLREGEPFARFYLAQKARGKRLASYSCSGPSKLLDPYAYYRLQAWHCFALGADEEFFWAFGDNAGNSCWNAYWDPRHCYTPLFLDEEKVTAAKHMEAIAEGVQDYEILAMLRRAAERPKGKGGEEARRLLEKEVEEVLSAVGVEAFPWRVPKDRTLADRVREQALGILEQALTGP